MLHATSLPTVEQLSCRLPQGGFERLEPYEGKLSRTVLRGGSDSNVTSLPDTLQQAARRSWRIGQKQPVDVYFLGYEKSAQIPCLTLMAKKIAVSQSTSGDTPDTGLDVLNQDGDSIEIALAKQLIA